MKLRTMNKILDELNNPQNIDPSKRYTITEEWLNTALWSVMTGANEVHA